MEETVSSTPEWSTEDWTKAWTIHVGKAYLCEVCGTIVMVTKGGVGTLEPVCCEQPMKLVKRPDEVIRD
jgi:desulfoferrodoxin-like iron-binding protein